VKSSRGETKCGFWASAALAQPLRGPNGLSLDKLPERTIQHCKCAGRLNTMKPHAPNRPPSTPWAAIIHRAQLGELVNVRQWLSPPSSILAFFFSGRSPLAMRAAPLPQRPVSEKGIDRKAEPTLASLTRLISRNQSNVHVHSFQWSFTPLTPALRGFFFMGRTDSEVRPENQTALVINSALREQLGQV